MGERAPIIAGALARLGSRADTGAPSTSGGSNGRARGSTRRSSVRVARDNRGSRTAAAIVVHARETDEADERDGRSRRREQRRCTLRSRADDSSAPFRSRSARKKTLDAHTREWVTQYGRSHSRTILYPLLSDDSLRTRSDEDVSSSALSFSLSRFDCQ